MFYLTFFFLLFFKFINHNNFTVTNIGVVSSRSVDRLNMKMCMEYLVYFFLFIEVVNDEKKIHKQRIK